MRSRSSHERCHECAKFQLVQELVVVRLHKGVTGKCCAYLTALQGPKQAPLTHIEVSQKSNLVQQCGCESKTLIP